jgi:amino acid transporter
LAQGPSLKRVLSMPMLVLYGLGTTIGAGIYALIGEVAGSAGAYAPVSFLVAGTLATLSGLSFAELGARMPSSAGEARFVREGLDSAALALIVGLLVVASGVVSSAAVTNGFAGYFMELTDAPRLASVAGVVILLGALAAWGIGESVAAAAVLTLIEAGGLLLVIWAGSNAVVEPLPSFGELVPPLELAAWGGIFVGSFLAFFAFVGFEDMVNVAEEVKDVTRVMPRAIIVTLIVTLVLYVALALVAVRSVPVEELAASQAPLALVYSRATGWSADPISVIAVLATVNGALIQIVMASRVLYGLSAQGQLPAAFGRVNARTRTPIVATVTVTAVVLVLALAFRTAPLAQATAFIVLCIFSLVNLALWRLKRHTPAPDGVPDLPIWVPILGFHVSVAFAGGELVHLIFL